MKPLHRSLRTLFAIIPILTAACSLEGPLAPVERRELDRARARWEAHRPAEYTFESRISCFCDPAVSVWTEIHVRHDSVVATTPLTTLPAGSSAAPPSAWLTVPGLFAVIESSAQSNFTRDVTVTFDEQYGYPRTIAVTCQENVTDCGVIYEARNLRPAQ